MERSSGSVFLGAPMSAPFAPPPHPVVWFVVTGIILVAIAMPFGRRDDWLGWVAFVLVWVVALGLWTLLIGGALRTFIEWYRDKPNNS
jgi:hypothetical protein